ASGDTGSRARRVRQCERGVVRELARDIESRPRIPRGGDPCRHRQPVGRGRRRSRRALAPLSSVVWTRRRSGNGAAPCTTRPDRAPTQSPRVGGIRRHRWEPSTREEIAMAARKQPLKNVVKGEEEEQNELLVEIFGVTMLMPKQKKVVMPNGVKGRLSMDKLSVVAPHIAFIAFEKSKYEPPPKMNPVLSFSYDIDGYGKKEILFDAFLFDKHTVRFEDVAPRETKFSIDDIPTVADLSKDIEI